VNKDELYMCVWDAWRNRVYQGLKRSQIMHECGLPAVVQRSPPIQCSMPRTSLRATPKARLCTKGPRCCRQGYTTDRGDLPTLGGQGTRRIGGTYRPHRPLGSTPCLHLGPLAFKRGPGPGPDTMHNPLARAARRSKSLHLTPTRNAVFTPHTQA